MMMGVLLSAMLDILQSESTKDSSHGSTPNDNGPSLHDKAAAVGVIVLWNLKSTYFVVTIPRSSFGAQSRGYEI